MNLKIPGLLRSKAPRNDVKKGVIASGAKQPRNKVYSSTITLSLCFLLTACGFRPLYMTRDGNSDICYPIKILTIKNRHGQILRNHLLDLLTPQGAPLKPQYTLNVKLTETIKDIGVNKDETTRRQEALLTALITLQDANNKTVYTHSVIAINSFEIINENYYADVVAEDYAQREALILLAEKIKLAISAYLDTKNEN